MPLVEEDEKNILYELLVHYEWLVESDLRDAGGDVENKGYKWLALHSQLPSLVSLQYLNPWSSPAILPQLKRILNCSCDWHLAIGGDGAVIGILLQTSLEIRSQKDDYTTAVGKTSNIYHDPFPSWRKLAWCSDCSMLAVGYSNGVVEIFNLSATSLFKVYPPRFQEGYMQGDPNKALSALFFSTARTKGLKWSTEMVLIDFHGNIRSYFVSSTEGYQECTTFSLQNFYTFGITAVTNTRSLLIVAGHSGHESDQRLKMNGMGHGLTIWRMTNEFPYYIQVPTVDQDAFLPRSPRLMSGFGTSQHDAIFRLCVSPLGRQVAAIHISGSISIWDMPSLRKRKFWLLRDQPHYKLNKRQRGKHVKALNIGELLNNPIDVKWWSEDAIILSRLSGSVTVCSVFSLSNLLGGSPEFFEGVPQISEANDKCFLALEFKWQNENYSYDSVTNVKENKGYTKLIKNVLYWATDSERFQPSPGTNRISSKTYRLLSLKSTTPDELYERKIEMEEFGDALSISHKYSLDCDLVYHRQWCKNPVTIATIQDYLSKIKKRSLVLSECISRVPNDIDATRELLLFGLRGTELDTLVAIKRGTDQDEFLLSDLLVEYEEFEWDDENSKFRAAEIAVKDLQMRTELISQIDFFNLSEAQIDVVEARQKLLFYYDRLGTYEAYLGGMSQAVENYDYKFYEKFRQQSDIEACLEFAREGNWKGVEAMFTYHGENTIKHRIAILSNFPPVMGPFEYRHLLPECDLSGQLIEWEEDKFRDADWCEDEIFSREADHRAIEIEETLYEKPSYLKEYKNLTLNGDNIGCWYLLRAREIERSVRFADIALDLLRFGRDSNARGLEDLLSQMNSLEILIYEIGITNINLNKFEQMTDLEKLKLFMSTSSNENHMQNLQSWGIPFLDKCESKQAGVKSHLLKNYIVSTAKDDLSIALKSVRVPMMHSESGEQFQSIFNSLEDVLTVAIDSIYYCENPTQLPRAFAILANLPIKENNASEQIIALHQEVDILEDLLEVSDILSDYELLETPKYLRSVQNDKRSSVALLSKVARNFVKRGKLVKLNDWKKLVKDSIEMQQKLFYQIEQSEVYEIVTDAMLTSGIVEYLNFSREFMETRKSDESLDTIVKLVAYENAVKLVLKAARDYFNSAEDYNSEEIHLARHCLRLIESEDACIIEELDLISALQILPDFGLKLLPLQVRLCEDRIRIVEECILSSEVRYYHGARLLHLSKLLRVCDGNIYERESKVISLLATAALQAKDFDSASIWCDEIVTKGYKEAWLVCASLGRCQHFNSITLRAKLLDFALAYGDEELLDQFLRDRTELELSLLCTSVQNKIQPNISLESEEGFEDANSVQEEESCDEFSDAICDNAKTGTHLRQIIDAPIDITKGLMTATAFTSKIASTVTTRKFWKGASGWLSPFVNEATKKIIGVRKSEEIDKKFIFQVPSCHAFYKGMWSCADTSSLGISYESYDNAVSENSFLIPFNVLRIALMSENFPEISTDQLNDYGVKEEIAKNFILEDIPLGLSFVLSVLTIEDAEKFFHSLPQTELCLQVSLYYYAIQIHCRISNYEKSQFAPVYLSDPSELVIIVSELVKDTFDDLVLDSLKAKFNRTITRLREFNESEDLRDLGTLVDIERFLSDSTYKTDTLLGLALTSDPAVLQMAVKLAQKYDVPTSQIYLACLQHLFDSSADIDDIQRIIEEKNMLIEFQKNVKEFIAHMEANIFISISGKDYEKIIYFYNTMLKVVGPNPNHEAYLKILNYLVENNISVDFKAFLGPNTNLLPILKPFFTSKNVSQFAVLVDLLPHSDSTSSAVYRAWTQESFFLNLESKNIRNSRYWVSRFSYILKALKNMEVTDIELLLEHIFLSKEACRIPLNAKHALVKASLEQCLSFKAQRPDDRDRFDMLNNRLEKIKSHLKHLESPVFKSLLQSNAPLCEYAQQYEMSGGNEIALGQLSRQVLLDKCSLSILREVLSVYPEEFTLLPEDILIDVLQHVLDKIINDEDMMDVLEHLLIEFVTYDKDGGELISEEDVVDKIREYTKKDGGAVDRKVKILSLAKNYLTLDNDDLNDMHALKTGEIIQNVLSMGDDQSENGLEPENLNLTVKTTAQRINLFDKLLNAITSIGQAESIFELLSIWPSFEESIYTNIDSNPWAKLIHKLVHIRWQHDDTLKSIKLIHSVVKHSMMQHQLNSSFLYPIISHLSKSKDNDCLLEIAKITFIHADQRTINEFINALDSNLLLDDELFEIIVDKKLVSNILHCTLYGEFYSYLRNNGSSNFISATATQLQDSGFILEAANIRLLDSSLPDALRTATFPLLKALNRFL